MAGARYRIEFAPSARRAFLSLDKAAQKRLRPHIESLAGDPRPAGAKALTGRRGQLRLRVGDYRIVYVIEDDVLLVLVVRVGHRKDVYR